MLLKLRVRAVDSLRNRVIVNTAVKDLRVRVGKRTCRAAVDAKVMLWLFIFIRHLKRMNVETITRNDLR